MTRPASRLTMMAAVLLGLGSSGCSDRPEPVTKGSQRIEDFRVIKFAGESVVVPFRSDPPTEKVPGSVAGESLRVGNRVVLGDLDRPEVFLALDLVALQFYHSTPTPDQLGRFRLLGDEGRLFVVTRGTIATVKRVVDDELPEGLKAIEVTLAGPKGGTAWVSDPFVHRVGDGPKDPR